MPRREPWVVARPVAFFAPADQRGKWHATWKADDLPVCGARTPLLPELRITPSMGDWSDQVHPLVCRNCLMLTTQHGPPRADVHQ
jgi:hypothetical protein